MKKPGKPVALWRETHRLLAEGSDVVRAVQPVGGTPRCPTVVRHNAAVRDTPLIFIDARQQRERLTALASSMDAPMKLMEFTDDNRIFVCRAESSPATPGTLWWWISVTGESSRYAAFRAESDDTAKGLRPRVLAYYQQMLADRARPPVVRQHWAQRRAALSAAASATPAAAIPGSPSGSRPLE